jgi:alpha-tubulin suppressor-like RCC1 family protein
MNIRALFLCLPAILLANLNLHGQTLDARNISAGGNHTVAVKSDGTVWAWGMNTYGQLGDNTTTRREAPVQVSGLSDVVAVAAGTYHSVALKSDKTVWAWGSNDGWALAKYSQGTYPLASQISGVTDVKAIAAGEAFTVVLKEDGTVWTWGTDSFGQLGNGPSSSTFTPVQVSGLTDVIAISAKTRHVLALTSDGRVWAWGYNNKGQLGDGTTTTRGSPVQVSGLYDVAAIATGDEHSVALTQFGTVLSWGENSDRQLGNGTTTDSLSPVSLYVSDFMVAIGAGANASMAVRWDGAVFAWGSNQYRQLGDGGVASNSNPVQISGLDDVEVADVGGRHAVALTSSGNIIVWGSDDTDQMGNGPEVSNSPHPVAVTTLNTVIAVGAGNAHTLWVTQGGYVWASGDNSGGQLGDGTTTKRTTPVPVVDLENVTAVSGGGNFSLALKADGTVWAWGNNSSGQLGDNTTTSSTAPVQVLSLTDVVKIEAGDEHALALKSDGSVWAWGSNSYGQLGIGNTTNQTTPAQVSSLAGITQIAAGGGHSLALKSDNTIWAWGRNDQGQVGDNSTTNRSSPVHVFNALYFNGQTSIAAGSSHSVATGYAWGLNTSLQVNGDTGLTRSLVPVEYDDPAGSTVVAGGTTSSSLDTTDGTGHSWGANNLGQIGNGAQGVSVGYRQVITTPDITQMAMGTSHSVALRKDGSSVTWGSFPTGASGVGFVTPPTGRKPEYIASLRLLPSTPTLSISSPVSGTTVPLGSVASVEVGASLNGGSAASVSLYHHGVLLGTSDSSPFAIDFEPITWGRYELTAVAVDSTGIPCRTAAIVIQTPYNSDSDVFADYKEIAWFGNLAQNGDGDFDGDGLTNAYEAEAGLAPHLWDTDGDGFSDGYENSKGTNPLDSGDKPTLALASGKRITAGNTHTVVVRSDGTVWAWGRNGMGQISDGPTSWLWPHIESVPIQLSNLTDITSVAAGTYHTLALKSDGTVWAWGSNPGGLFGDNTTNSSATPGQVSGLTGIVAVAAGYQHSLAVRNDGKVFAWGANGSGQLGDGTTTQQLEPVEVPGLTGIVAVAAAENFSLAVKNDGTVWAWGANGSGQLGDGTTTTRPSPVPVSGITDAIGVACCHQYGMAHSVVVRSGGGVLTWGHNGYGELGDGSYTSKLLPAAVPGLTGVVEVDAGPGYTMALKSDGTVWAWGYNDCGRLGNGTTVSGNIPVQVSGLTNAVAIAAGVRHSSAVGSDGKVHAWGFHVDGALGDDSMFVSSAPVQSSGVTEVAQVAAGHDHVVAVKSNGTVWTWGGNWYHQLGDGTNLSKADPVQVAGLTDVVMAAANADHSLVVKDDGTVWSWGYNWYGQLGDGSTTNRSAPVQVTGITGASQVAAGRYHSLALKSDGTVRAWGTNTDGQLGDNTTDQRLTSVAVSGLTSVSAIATGGGHSMALKSDGTVWAWGRNTSGQLGNNTTTGILVPVQVVTSSGALANVTAIACGVDHSMALKSDGTVWVWGANNGGQLDDGTTTSRSMAIQVSGLSGVVAIGAGVDHSLAVRSNGELWVKGGPSWTGHLGNGSTGHHLVQATGGRQLTVGLKEDGSLIAFGISESGQFGEGLPWNRETYAPVAVKALNVLYTAPQVSIVSPATSPSAGVLGQEKSIIVEVTPGDSLVSSVSLYHHGVLAETDWESPFTFTFTPWTYGDFELRAIGTDPLGLQTARSAPLTIRVPYDSDTDELPDWWETFNFGHLLFNENSDGDADGYGALEEFQAGSSPGNAGSTPVDPGGGGGGQQPPPQDESERVVFTAVRVKDYFYQGELRLPPSPGYWWDMGHFLVPLEGSTDSGTVDDGFNGDADVGNDPIDPFDPRDEGGSLHPTWGRDEVWDDGVDSDNDGDPDDPNEPGVMKVWWTPDPFAPWVENMVYISEDPYESEPMVNSYRIFWSARNGIGGSPGIEDMSEGTSETAWQYLPGDAGNALDNVGYARTNVEPTRDVHGWRGAGNNGVQSVQGGGWWWREKEIVMAYVQPTPDDEITYVPKETKMDEVSVYHRQVRLQTNMPVTAEEGLSQTFVIVETIKTLDSENNPLTPVVTVKGTVTLTIPKGATASTEATATGAAADYVKDVGQFKVIELETEPTAADTSKLLEARPVGIYTDLNNDGKVDGVDQTFASKAFESGATEEVVDAGTEFIFQNDDLSNGAWDRDDTVTWPMGKPSDPDDDDAEEIYIMPENVTTGQVWLDHPGIARMKFYESAKCTGPELPLSEASKFDLASRAWPTKIYVRVDYQESGWDGDHEKKGNLKLMYTPSGGGETRELARLKVTIIRDIRSKKHHRAAADYIAEKNTKHYINWIRRSAHDSVYVVYRGERALPNGFEPRGRAKRIDHMLAQQCDAVITGNYAGARSGGVGWDGWPDWQDGQIYETGSWDAARSHTPLAAPRDGYWSSVRGIKGIVHSTGKGTMPPSTASSQQQGMGGLVTRRLSGDGGACAMGRVRLADKSTLVYLACVWSDDQLKMFETALGTDSITSVYRQFDGGNSTAFAICTPAGFLFKPVKVGLRHDPALEPGVMYVNQLVGAYLTIDAVPVRP